MVGVVRVCCDKLFQAFDDRGSPYGGVGVFDVEWRVGHAWGEVDVELCRAMYGWASRWREAELTPGL